MNKAPIIAFGHQSRVGKNTAAEGVNLGLSVLGIETKMWAFASLLKAQARQLWWHHGLENAAFYEKPENAHLRDVALPGIGKTPVELWIEHGQAVRSVHPLTWAEAVLGEHQEHRVLIITDLRFDNEGDLIHKLGGLCVKVEREGCAVRGSDRSIRGDFKWNATIVNDHDVAGLQSKALYAAKRYIEDVCGWAVPA